MPIVNPTNSQILYPTPKKSYNSDFFMILDHECINLKGTYYSDTDSTAAKIVKIFAKSIIIIFISAVKIILVVTLITPIVLASLSAYHNREITSGNKNLNRKALAFVKASEAHMSLGNVLTAVDEQSNQSNIIEVNNYAKVNMVKNRVKLIQDKAKIHQNLIDAATAWGHIIREKARILNGYLFFNREEFLTYAVQSLVDKGHPTRTNINYINATHALSDNLYPDEEWARVWHSIIA